jgi:hypothetical protein
MDGGGGSAQVVAMLVRGDKLNYRYLSHAAQRIVADFLLAEAPDLGALAWSKDEWDWSAREFLWAAELGYDPDLRAQLVDAYQLDDDRLPKRCEPVRSWEEDTLVELVRANRAEDIPYLDDRFLKTTAFNLIADLDAGTGNVLAYLGTLWPAATLGSPLTFGEVLDAYAAATSEGPQA